MTKEMEKRSKYLSYLLRHKPEEVKCTLDTLGFLDVATLIENSDFTLEELKAIVEADTRYEFSSDYSKLRAFHGHSVSGVVPYKEIIPTGYIYHGTSKKGLKGIREDKLIKSMSRNYVHCSFDETKAKAIGARHGSPVILVIDAERAYKAGIKFYDSEDDVILTEFIPYSYVVDVIVF